MLEQPGKDRVLNAERHVRVRLVAFPVAQQIVKDHAPVASDPRSNAPPDLTVERRAVQQEDRQRVGRTDRAIGDGMSVKIKPLGQRQPPGAHQITPSDLPTLVKAATARSICSEVWAALIWVRIRA